jgi:hypothetical protein
MKNNKYNKFEKIYNDRNSKISNIPNNNESIKLFLNDLKYKNEEGDYAKPSDINPNISYSRSKYEYNSIKNRLSRKKVKELYGERETYHNNYKLLEHNPSFSNKYYTFNHEDMYNFNKSKNNIPQNKLKNYKEKTYGDTGNNKDNIDNKKNYLKYNIRNKRPNFPGMAERSVRTMHNYSKNNDKEFNINRGPRYKDAINIAKDIVRMNNYY